MLVVHCEGHIVKLRQEESRGVGLMTCSKSPLLVAKMGRHMQTWEIREWIRGKFPPETVHQDQV